MDVAATEAVVVVVGAGPTGTSVAERLAARARTTGPGRLVIHLVDPFPAGPGRHWRADQSTDLLLNTMAKHVTLFVEGDSEHPRPGPSLAQWCRGEDALRLPDRERREAATLGTDGFASRPLLSHYLRWVLHQVESSVPAHVSLHVHRDRATALDTAPDGRDVVRLRDGGAITADAVVLALGHLDGVAPPALGRADVTVHPPQLLDRLDLDSLGPGEPVGVRGLGLAFVDVVAMLTHGRGGRFEDVGDGRLRYHRSGSEPRLLAGSRRGLPYLPKPVTAARAQAPTAGLAALVDDLIAAGGPVDLRRQVWPTARREAALCYYGELGADPDVMGPLLREGVTEAVVAAAAARAHGPDAVLDLARLAEPFAGRRWSSAQQVHDDVLAEVAAAADLRRRAPATGAGLAAGFFRVFLAVNRLLDAGVLTARSRRDDVDRSWTGLFNVVTTGPPPVRHAELHALAESGVLRFVGPRMVVEPRGAATVVGSAWGTAREEVSTVVEAHLPYGVRSCGDPFVAALDARQALPRDVVDGYDTGLVAVDPRDGSLPSTTAEAPRRWALGPFTTALPGGNFTRPVPSAAPARLVDELARSVLSGPFRAG